MRPNSLIFFLLPLGLSVACAPAHRDVGGDGGIDPDNPRPVVCGDLFVNPEANEECDDGNTDDGDGCSSECKVEIPDNCGDGVLDEDEGEECDDGGNEGGDGCGAGCWIEGCGNNFLDPGEACEDNNTVGGDGCSADCKSDETCGNDIKDPGEDCDDGNDDNSDECPETCKAAECGDGFVQSGVESCDDGNDVDGDGCTDCILDSCGNGDLDDGEECDLGAGNGLNGTTCFRNCISTEIEAGQVDTIALDPHNFFGSNPQDLQTGDFNDDGRADVLIGDPSAGFTNVAYGLGDGRIWPAISLFHSAGGSLRASELVDVNNDSVLDIVGVTSGDSVVVMLGNGTGFEQATVDTTIIDIGGDNPLELVVAELTGDAFIDVATANNTSNDVVILAGDGTGRFTATTRLATPVGDAGQRPQSLAVGDIDNDGNVDIVSANNATDDVSVFRGLGSGQYGVAEVFTTRVGAGGSRPADIVVTDVTNDGIADVIVACSNSDDVVVLAAAGGNLAAPQRFSTLVGDRGDSPVRLAVADVTQDGVKDLITANSASHDLTVLPGLGPGVAFGSAELLSNLAPGDLATSPREVQVGDFNTDSIADIAVANASTGDVSVFMGTGDGEFSAMQAYAVRNDFDGGAPSILKIGDVNGDGNQDLVTATSSSITTLAGLGDGRFTPSQAISGLSSAGAGIGDFNNDGTLDFVSVFSTTLRSFIQQYNGAFTGISSSSASTSGLDVAVGEFTGDNFPDAAFISSTQIVYMQGSESGQFTALQTSSFASSVRRGTLADVTGDGALDSVVAGQGQNAVLIGSGTGTGSFAAPALVDSSAGSSGLAPVSVATADLNGDQRLDIVTANRSTNDLTVLIGEGSGAFEDPLIVPTVFGADPANVEDVAIGDFNGDGIFDLAAVNPARDTVSIMLGFGDGLFAAPQTYPVVGEPFSLTVADFDGDGIDDIAVAAISGGTITTFTSFAHP